MTPFRNWTQADIDAHQVKVRGNHIANAGKKVSSDIGIPTTESKQSVTGRGKPNKGELEYSRRLELEFPGAMILFEGLHLMMSNGHRYTPDWFVYDGKTILCVEVKARGANGFRMPSYQRAKLAFDQCRVEYPFIQFRWAEKHKGQWSEKTYGA